MKNVYEFLNDLNVDSSNINEAEISELERYRGKKKLMDAVKKEKKKINISRKIISITAATAIIVIGAFYGESFYKENIKSNTVEYKVLAAKDIKNFHDGDPSKFYDMDADWNELNNKGTDINNIAISNGTSISLDKMMLLSDNELLISADISSENKLLDENTKYKDEDGNIHDLGVYDGFRAKEDTEIFVDNEKLTNDLLYNVQVQRNDDNSNKCYMTFTNINKEIFKGDPNEQHSIKISIKNLESLNSSIAGKWDFEFVVNNNQIFEDKAVEMAINHQFDFGSNGVCSFEKYSRINATDFIYAKVDNFSYGADYYKLKGIENPNTSSNKLDADHLMLIGHDEFGNKVMFTSDYSGVEAGEIVFQRSVDNADYKNAKVLTLTPYYGVTESCERDPQPNERSVCGEEFTIDISNLK